MATVYDLPAQFKDKVPDLDFQDRGTYKAREDKFLAELKAFLTKRNPQKYVGEIVTFPMADSYAQYMVASMRPVELVHLPLMDGWDFQYAHLMTAKEIKQNVDGQKALERLFGNK